MKIYLKLIKVQCPSAPRITFFSLVFTLDCPSALEIAVQIGEAYPQVRYVEEALRPAACTAFLSLEEQS